MRGRTKEAEELWKQVDYNISVIRSQRQIHMHICIVLLIVGVAFVISWK